MFCGAFVGAAPFLCLVKQCISQGRVWAPFLRPPCGTWSRASGTTPQTSADPWRTGSISAGVLRDNKCAQAALQLAKRLHNRESPWAPEHPETSLLWETSEYRASMHLLHVFVGHLQQYQFGSLSRRASIIILGHVDPHHVLRLRRKCLSFRSGTLHVLWSAPCVV